MNQEYLQECLNYCAETGIFVWKIRPISHFPDKRAAKSWNRRYAGQVAGCNNGQGYWKITINDAPYQAHRLAWLHAHGHLPVEVDHLNHNRLDNSLANLRATTSAGNKQNLPIRSTNKSGVTGVHRVRGRAAWTAQIRGSGKKEVIGQFKDWF